MTPEPTTNEAPAQPEIATPVFNPNDGPAPTTPYPGQPDNTTPITIPVESGQAENPTAEQVHEARKAIEKDMRDAVPFNRLAIHTGFQRVIQAAVSSYKPEKVGMLCTAFRNYAEAEANLRG
jgi:hypothetical protein